MAETKTLLHAAACAALLLAAGPGRAQNPAPVSHEAELRARDAAAAAKTAALVEADKHHPRIGGVWLIEDQPAALRALDGKLPAMTPAGRALYAKRVADRKAGKADDPADRCLPPGTPRVLWSGEPFMITQAPAKVMVFHQYRHIVRHIPLDGPIRAADLDPTWEGTSSGHWDGDSLVIETAGFNGRQWLDQGGLPQSPDMKVTERLHLAAPDVLEDRVTLEDPQFYPRPWTTVVHFRRLPPDTNLIEEECSEKLLEFPLKNYAPSDQ